MKSLLDKISIRRKGALIALTAASGLFVSAVLGYFALNEMSRNLDTTAQRSLPSLVSLSAIKGDLTSAHLQMMRLTTSISLQVDASAIDAQRNALTAAQESARDTLESFIAETTAGAADDGEAAAIVERFQEYVDQTTAALDLISLDPAFGSVLVSAADTMYRDLAAEVLAISDQRAGVIQAEIDAAVETGHDDLVRYIVVSLICAAVAIGVTVWVIGAITTPLRRTQDVMTVLATDDVDVAIPDVDRSDEIGQMARALMVFKDNAVARRAQAEAEREQARAEAVRAANSKRLQTEIAGLAAQAAEGDFSARLSTQFDQDELNAVARDMNRVMALVQSGLDTTNRVMRRVADGDLCDRMSGDHQGAFADLQTNINDMVERLATLIARIVETSDDVRSGAEQIAAGAGHLAARAEQQASSLEETAATMEEMSASIKSNADSSASANAMASDASSRASAGGAIVEGAVSAMRDIESGAAEISDIISVIDGIAFQTNLLALNAAVEAARAGDAGKGFAVVASEVRALAQRSSDAARDIRGLIETSTRQVSDGVRYVSEAGASLEGIVSSIAEVEDAVKTIASASIEQSSGVQEISSTISQMDDLTQQNAAMADQSAASARELVDGAAKLQELVSVFKVDETATGSEEWRAA